MAFERFGASCVKCVARRRCNSGARNIISDLLLAFPVSINLRRLRGEFTVIINKYARPLIGLAYADDARAAVV